MSNILAKTGSYVVTRPISKEFTHANIEVYRARATKNQKKATRAIKRPSVAAVRKQRLKIIKTATPDRLITQEAFDKFLDALKDGLTKSDYCKIEGNPCARFYTRFMIDFPKEAERYKNVCRAQPFAWQARNKTLNQYGLPDSGFPLAVKTAFNNGEPDADIAARLGVTKNSVIFLTKQYRLELVAPFVKVGMTDKEIADKIGYQLLHVQQITRKLRAKK